MSLTEKFARGISEMSIDSVTDADVEAVRLMLLDHLGVCANGASTDTAEIAYRWALHLGAAGTDLPIVGTARVLPGVQASLVNAVASHSIEYDDVHSASSLHPGVVIFPAVTAAASITNASDEQLLLAVVRGYETMCRVGRAANPASHYARNYHPTATAGVFGATAAVATLVELDAKQLASAFGVAATMASGSMQFLVDGSSTKRLHPALAVRSGLEAAILAREGFDGGGDGIGGPRAFLASMCEDPKPDELLAEWGERELEVRLTSIKAHTCCRYKQGPIDALIELRNAFDLRPSDVESILVALPSVAIDIVAEPAEDKVRPRTVVDAQFSMPFGAAVAIIYGQAGLEEYTDEVLGDPEVQGLMRRTTYTTDRDIDRHYPRQWRAWVRVTTTSGEVLERHVLDPKGDPSNPFSPTDLRAKFDRLTLECFSATQREAVASAAAEFGTSGSYARLTAGLRQ